jgi:signal transduction histidine kinase
LTTRTLHATEPTRGPDARVDAVAPSGIEMECHHELSLARLESLARVARATAHDVRGAAGTLAVHTALLAEASRDDRGADDDDAPAARAARRRWIAALDESRGRLLALVEGVLAVACVPDDGPGSCDLAARTAAALALLAPVAAGRRVQLRWHAPAAPVPVQAGPDVVLQAVLDAGLLLLDATAPGGTVTVEVAPGPPPRIAWTAPDAAWPLADDAAGVLARRGQWLESAGVGLVVRGGAAATTDAGSRATEPAAGE